MGAEPVDEKGPLYVIQANGMEKEGTCSSHVHVAQILHKENQIIPIQFKMYVKGGGGGHRNALQSLNALQMQMWQIDTYCKPKNARPGW